jgi:hypothetical protein
MYSLRKKEVLELRGLLRVAKRHLLRVVLLGLSTTYLIFLLTLESSNGVVSVSEIMKLFCSLSL